MRGRLRLLPVLIFSATCLLSIKVIDIADGLLVHVPTLGVGQSLAAGDAAETMADEAAEPRAEATGDTEPGEVPAGGAPTMAEDGSVADPAAMDAPRPLSSVVMALGEEPAYATPPLPLGDPAYHAMGAEDPVYTPEELAVLQALGERRTALDEREALLDARERQLAVAEARIDEKIAEMTALQARIEELLALYDANEEEEIMSLVKIYETMKPKDAAPIFDSLDMDILLEIISRMSNIRSAPILARMDPVRAQQVTEELARRLQQRPEFMVEAEGQ